MVVIYHGKYALYMAVFKFVCLLGLPLPRPRLSINTNFGLRRRTSVNSIALVYTTVGRQQHESPTVPWNFSSFPRAISISTHKYFYDFSQKRSSVRQNKLKLPNFKFSKYFQTNTISFEFLKNIRNGAKKCIFIYSKMFRSILFWRTLDPPLFFSFAS